MPKEQLPISEFKGIDLPSNDPSAPIWLEGADVSVSDAVLMPEKTDIISAKIRTQLDIFRKDVYVDGQQKLVKGTYGGKLHIDDDSISYNIGRGNLAFDSIGRQGILIDEGNAKFIRIGYPEGKSYINFDRNDIIFEDDIIRSNYTNLLQFEKIIMITEDMYIGFSIGHKCLVAIIVDDGTQTVNLHYSYPIAHNEILSITHDAEVSGDGISIENVYCAYKDKDDYYIKSFDVAAAFSEPFNPAEFTSKERISEGFICIKDSDNVIPETYSLGQIARTKNMMFFSFCYPLGDDNYKQIKGQKFDKNKWVEESTEIGEDEDLLFAFDHNDSDYLTATYLETGKQIRKSMLPWNPYKTANFHYKTKRPLRFAGYTSWDDLGFDSVGNANIRIPPFVENVKDDLKLVELINKFKLKTSDNDTHILLPMPDNAGVADYLEPTGRLVQVDYENDIVSTLIRAGGKIEDGNASRIRSYFRNPDVLGQSYYAGCSSSSIGTIKTTEDNSFLYTWNGIDDSVEYKYSLCPALNSIPETFLSYKRFFDESDSEYFCRRTINIHNASQVGFELKSLSVFMYNDTGSIRSMIYGNGYPPPTITTKDKLGNYLDLVAKQEQDFIGVANKIEDSEAQVYGIQSKETMETFDGLITYRGDPVIKTVSRDAITNTWQENEEYDVMDFFEAEAVPLVGNEEGYSENDIVKYKLAFVYDGTSVGPLSEYSITRTSGSEFKVRLQVKVNLDQLANISKRITGINIYGTMMDGDEAIDLYRLVVSVNLDWDTFSPGDPEHTYFVSSNFYDKNSRLVSFNADAGYSEAMDTVSVARQVQCVCQNYLFVGNVRIFSKLFDGMNTDNLVIRSLPFQPSFFNFIEDFVVLGHTPTSLIAFNNRVYAFGQREYSIINPDTMAIEHVSNSCGAAKRQHVAVCDHGIFVYYENNIYHIDMQKVSPIGDAISTLNRNIPSYTNGSYTIEPFGLDRCEQVLLAFMPAKQELIVAVTRGGIVGAFALGLKTNKWSYYQLHKYVSKPPIYFESGYARLLSVFEWQGYVYIAHRDKIGVAGFLTCLFAGSENRKVVSIWEIDAGNKGQRKVAYKATATKDGVEVDDATIEAYFDDDTAAKDMTTLTAPYSDFRTLKMIVSTEEPIDNITLIHRRKVVK